MGPLRADPERLIVRNGYTGREIAAVALGYVDDVFLRQGLIAFSVGNCHRRDYVGWKTDPSIPGIERSGDGQAMDSPGHLAKRRKKDGR